MGLFWWRPQETGDADTWEIRAPYLCLLWVSVECTNMLHESGDYFYEVQSFQYKGFKAITHMAFQHLEMGLISKARPKCITTLI